jgi:hypothetical protein
MAQAVSCRNVTADPLLRSWAVRVRCVVDRVARGQACLRVILGFPFRNIPRMFHINFYLSAALIRRTRG